MSMIESAIAQLIEVPLDTALAYLLALFAGIVVNWLWKCKREHINPVEYWTINRKASLLSLCGALGAFICTLVLEPNLGKSTYFAIGIACDSMLNKLPLPAAVHQKLRELNDADSDYTVGTSGGVRAAANRETGNGNT